MSGVTALCDGLLAGMWKTSWQVGALVVFVLAVQGMFGRWLTPRWRYALWLLVIARLFLPVVPQLSFGLVPWETVAASSESTALESADAAPVPVVRRARRTVPPPAAPAPERVVDSGPPAADEVRPAGERARRSAPRGTGFSAGTGGGGGSPSTAPSGNAGVPWSALLVSLWLAGVALLVLRVLVVERRFRRRLAGAETIADPAFRAVLEECRREVGVRREVIGVTTDLVATPAVCGVWRPRLLLPRHLLTEFSSRELRCVLLHELHHLRGPDVLLNGVLAGLGCLYWFHPLVRVAIARVRRAQENLRDWEALSTEFAPEPAQYAETVLKLLERRTERREAALAIGFLRSGRETRKRILMIANFDRRTPRTWSLGAGLFLLLGWASFTSATPEIPRGGEEAVEAVASSMPEIEVERHQPPPDWWADLDKALARRIDIDVEDVTLIDLLDSLRQVAGVNIVPQRGFYEDYGGNEFTLHLQGATVRKVLNVACRLMEDGVSYCYARHAICIGYLHELPQWTDLRIYKLGPLLEQGGEGEWLMDLTRMFTDDGHDAWDIEDVSIELWDELLFVRQTDAMHVRVHDFLNSVLRRHAGASRADADDGGTWRAAIEERLATTRVSVDFDRLDLGTAAEQLSVLLDVPVMVEGDGEGEDVSLRLDDALAADVLGWITDQTGLNVLLRDGVISLTRDMEVRLEIFELGELDDVIGDTEELRGYLEELIRNHVDPLAWDQDPRMAIAFWEDLMLITATPEMHAEIGQLIQAVVRALR